MEEASEGAELPCRLGDSSNKDILDDFTPTPMGLTLKGIVLQRQPGTNRWIFENSEVLTWLQDHQFNRSHGSSHDPSVTDINKLWLYGFQGCGKTVLAGTIIDYLIRNCSPQHAICYYFCSMLQLETIDPINILRTLLSQLALQNEGAFQTLLKCIQDGAFPVDCEVDGGKSFNRESIQDLANLLKLIVGRFSRVSLIVTSIDHMDTREEEIFLHILRPIIDMPRCNMRSLFTTADALDQRLLGLDMAAHAVFVRGQPDDIRTHAKTSIEKRLYEGARYLEEESVQRELEEHIVNRSNGSWLWAVYELEYQCENLRNGKWPPVFSQSDKTEEPPSYESFGPDQGDPQTAMFPYKQQLERVIRSGNLRSDFIFSRILKWLYTNIMMPDAQLTAKETCIALSLLMTHHGIESPQQTLPVQEHEIIEICGPLIRKSLGGEGFEFRHYTMDVYLRRNLTQELSPVRKFRMDRHTSVEVVNEFVILCNLLEDQHCFDLAESMHRKIVRIREKFYGSEHNVTLAALNNLGMFYEGRGRTREAETMYTRALNGYEKSQEPDRLAMFNTINDIGILCKNDGRYEEAEKFYKLVVYGREGILGTEHEATAGAMKNLALLYSQMRRFHDADVLWNRILPVYERLRGPNDIQTLQVVYNMGIIYKHQNRAEEAVIMLERTLRGYELALNSQDSSIPDALDSLGQLYLTQGRFSEAETSFQKALPAREKSQGPNDKCTIGILDNLGLVYKRQRRFNEAETVIKTAINRKEMVLGSNHESTLDSYDSLGNLYADRRQFSDAETVLQKALQGYEEVLGPDHKSANNTAINLAIVYSDAGRLADSEELYTKVLHSYERSLGREDLSTLDIINDIALLRARQHKLDDALEAWERAMHGFESIQGPDYEPALAAAHNIGLVHKQQGRVHEAEAMFRKALDGYERAFGVEHRGTKMVAGDLAELYESQGRYEEMQATCRRMRKEST